MTRYDDTIYIAGLQSLYNVGATYVRRFIEDFGSPYEAWNAVKNVENLKGYTYISIADKRAIAASARDEKLDYIIQKLDEYQMDVTTFLDKDFPSMLNQIYNPPAILFMRGNRALLDKRLNRIAIVGARRCSLYGRNVARMLGKELGKYSTIIVSGGARGIDSHGHEGLLASQGYVMGRSRRAILERARNVHRLNRVQKRETPMVCLMQSRRKSSSFRGQIRRFERNLVQTQGGLQLTGIGLNLVVVDRNNRRVIRIRGISRCNRRQSAQAQGCGKKNRSAGATVAAGTRRVSHHEVPSTWVIE